MKYLRYDDLINLSPNKDINLDFKCSEATFDLFYEAYKNNHFNTEINEVINNYSSLLIMERMSSINLEDPMYDRLLSDLCNLSIKRAITFLSYEFFNYGEEKNINILFSKLCQTLSRLDRGFNSWKYISTVIMEALYYDHSNVTREMLDTLFKISSEHEAKFINLVLISRFNSSSSEEKLSVSDILMKILRGKFGKYIYKQFLSKNHEKTSLSVFSKFKFESGKLILKSKKKLTLKNMEAFEKLFSSIEFMGKEEAEKNIEFLLTRCKKNSRYTLNFKDILDVNKNEDLNKDLIANILLNYDSNNLIEYILAGHTKKINADIMIELLKKTSSVHLYGSENLRKIRSKTAEAPENFYCDDIALLIKLDPNEFFNLILEEKD